MNPKRPWYLLWLVIPLGTLIFLVVVSAFSYDVLSWEVLPLFLIGMAILVSYLVLLVRIIAKSVNNRKIARGWELSLISFLLGVIAMIIVFSLPLGLAAIPFALLIVLAVVIMFGIAGIFFAIGFFKRNRLPTENVSHKGFKILIMVLIFILAIQGIGYMWMVSKSRPYPQNGDRDIIPVQVPPGSSSSGIAPSN